MSTLCQNIRPYRGLGTSVSRAAKSNVGGVSEFVQLLEKSLGSFDLEELGAGVAFMQALPRACVLTPLRTQQQLATRNRDHLDSLVSTVEDRARPSHTADLLELWSGSLSAIATWSSLLIQRLEAGEYVMAGEKPGGAGARREGRSSPGSKRAR
ncbi:hypothetical protein WA016_01545 [Myxococcus stipitatus]